MGDFILTTDYPLLIKAEKPMLCYLCLIKKIGVSFDETYFDSPFSDEYPKISFELLNNEAIFNKDGSISSNVISNSHVRKSRTSFNNLDHALYHLSRYINAANQLYKKHNFDSMFYVAPVDQDFLPVFAAVMNSLNYVWAKNFQFEHVKLVRIEGFNSKLKVEEALEKAKNGIVEVLQRDLNLEVDKCFEVMADRLGLSTLIINDFRQVRSMRYIFQWNHVLNLRGDTAASFMLCLDGLKNVPKDSKYKFNIDVDTSALLEPEAHQLIEHLARFDEVLFRAYRLQEPFVLYHFISHLRHLIYKATRVLRLDIKEDKVRVIKARLYLFYTSMKVLEKSLELLNIPPLYDVVSTEKPENSEQ